MLTVQIDFSIGILRERVSLALEDEGDPSQVDLNLTLGRRNGLSPPFRTIVLLHGTGKFCTSADMLSRAAPFIDRDCMVVLLNSRYHGCRAGKEFGGKERYLAELVRAWENNASSRASPTYPFIYDTAADLASVADYLLSRPDVSAEFLGIVGISLGGMHAWFAAAADERWKAIAPLIGVQSFNYAIERDCFHARVDSIRDVFDSAACDDRHEGITSSTVRAVWDRICPGLLNHFDAEKSLPLLFPRPVFIGNGELDPRCPIEGVRIAVNGAVQKCRMHSGDGGNFELRIYPDVAHEVTEDMWKDCVDFFCRVLKPATFHSTFNIS